ncbi:MAG: epimerase [Candidatus Muproteobacteria bacterium RIFCSPHIGHO2_01_FULL_65_16]|uniref:Epimerase n=1 Tax=Candidatus Muproteobacteria bacterium RIFCSPHIGHO2_01_FULL_65_16 TaxID=1817764 RepID=A0A1F6TRB3_9PROT|nr:MAG: epimerase [Candidatus Muproteobacteria bacterium RIFCSPHIGHO2_01_FULL_65_16]
MKICILGGTGFVGSRIAARLAAERREVLIPTRHADRHRELLLLPTVRIVEGDVHNPVFLRQQFQGMDAVINLVGILNEKGHRGRGFARAHAELPAKVVEACRQAGVRRLLHMSALNASLQAPSHYLRTKAMGEDTVHRAHGPDLAVTSFRPSVIFGPHDGFIVRFAGLLKLSPFVFPLACPNARLQPVYVEDVAQAYALALDDHGTFGKRYDLCGPKVYTLREIVEYTARLLHLRTRIVGLPDTLSRLQAAVMEFVPGKPFSRDNYNSLKLDSVCAKGFPEVFGIAPVGMEQIVPGYLGGGAQARYTELRGHAGR